MLNGTIAKYKARLVAKGFLQKERMDHEEMFAQVAKLEKIWLVTSIDISKGGLSTN